MSKKSKAAKIKKDQVDADKFTYWILGILLTLFVGSMIYGSYTMGKHAGFEKGCLVGDTNQYRSIGTYASCRPKSKLAAIAKAKQYDFDWSAEERIKLELQRVDIALKGHQFQIKMILEMLKNKGE